MPERIDRGEGRTLFGHDPRGYDAVRPQYPNWIFNALTDSGALFEGARTLEIGPGTGLATRHLIERGASPLMLVEPDIRFNDLLEALVREWAVDGRILRQPFEDVDLAANTFDLVVAATAFHWIEPVPGLRKARRLLVDGGTVALIWNVLQDLDRDDAFHEATRALLAPLSVSPSGVPDTVPFALDREAREREAREAEFQEIHYSESRWSLNLTTEETRILYGGFSQIQRLDEEERQKVLEALSRIADEQFDGRVERHVTSCLYQLC